MAAVVNGPDGAETGASPAKVNWRRSTSKPRAARAAEDGTAPGVSDRAVRHTKDSAHARARRPTSRSVSQATARTSDAVPAQHATADLELAAAAAAMRRALFNEYLADGLYVAAQVLADVLAPAVAQIWVSEQTPGMGETSRAGGQEAAPVLRLRASAERPAPDGQWPLASLGDASPTHDQSRIGPSSVPLSPTAPGGIIPEVAGTRRALFLRDAQLSPSARDWLSATTSATWLALATLAVYPLHVRGHLLGVLAIGSAADLSARQITLLEAACDACAIAIEHDRLLAYTHMQETLAQTVVREAPVAVAVLTGADHTFELANPAFAQLLGVEGPLKGRRLAQVVGDAPRLSESLRLDAVYTMGEPQVMVEIPIHLRRGLTYWNVTSSPLFGRRARVRGALVAAVDMTHQVLQRRRAIEAAQAARERVRQMMALHATSLAVASQLGSDPRELLADILRRSIALLNAGAGMVYIAEPSSDDLTVLVAEGLRGEYVGRRVAAGDGLAGRVARSGAGLRLDDTRLFRGTATLSAGEGVTAIMAVPLIYHKRVVGVLEVLDNADRRTFSADDLWLLELFAAQAAQAVENARTYVELERAYQTQRELDYMKDDFISTASHELRTPLTGVQGYLDLLLDYPGSRDEPLAVEFLRSAAQSAAELTELTERLLQTSRLESGQIEMRSESVLLRALIETSVRGLPADNEVSVAHNVTIAVDAGIQVHADAQRLREVLDNLLGNAVKYSPNGGDVRIGCRTGTITNESRPHELWQSDAPELYAIVTISDEGIGIPHEEHGRLFGRFARLEAARASQIRGTGLGLYICRQLMEAMGGSIWLEESVPEKGSTFALAVPLAAPQDHDGEPTQIETLTIA